MSATLDTSHFEMSPLNDIASRNMPHMVFTFDTSHFEMSPLNKAAFENMECMFTILDTSHFEISLSKEFALENTLCMSVTLDTFQFPIGPLEQSPFGDTAMHASTALCSSFRDRGDSLWQTGHAKATRPFILHATTLLEQIRHLFCLYTYHLLRPLFTLYLCCT